MSKKEKVPLCEDLDYVVLREGESCYSDCGIVDRKKTCDEAVLEPNLVFKKDVGCNDHTECIGQSSRVSCDLVISVLSTRMLPFHCYNLQHDLLCQFAFFHIP